jgi:hypothetical protein
MPKPVCFTVLADESPKRLSRDELVNMSNMLCYHHGGVLGAVSLPSYLYHAGQVAKRWKNNYSTEM